MAGFNANFRNLATDKDYSLRYDAGRDVATRSVFDPPSNGLTEIECGEIITETITETTFKALFRFQDIVANQRYYSFLCTFRIDEPDEEVTIYVRSAAFEPFTVCWRSVNQRFEINAEESTAVEKVIQFTTTPENVGPFILEITSVLPYQTGEFEVEMVCGGPSYLTAIRAGTRDHAYAVSGGSEVTHPPILEPYATADFQLGFPEDESEYTWSVVSGSLHGLTLSSDGLLGSPALTKQPPWASMPLSGNPLVSPSTIGWVDSNYELPWRGHRQHPIDITAYTINFTVHVEGAGPNGGHDFFVSVPVGVSKLYGNFNAGGISGSGPLPGGPTNPVGSPIGNTCFRFFKKVVSEVPTENYIMTLEFHDGLGWFGLMLTTIYSENFPSEPAYGIAVYRTPEYSGSPANLSGDLVFVGVVNPAINDDIDSIIEEPRFRDLAETGSEGFSGIDKGGWLSVTRAAEMSIIGIDGEFNLS